MKKVKKKSEVKDVIASTPEPAKLVKPVNKQCARELKAVPEDIQDAVMFQLSEFVAVGEQPSCAHKKLRDDVMQLSFPYEGDTYRAFYSTKNGELILLLIVFKKKTNGQATEEIDLAQKRLKSWRTGQG